jgi:hypothetical protein
MQTIEKEPVHLARRGRPLLWLAGLVAAGAALLSVPAVPDATQAFDARCDRADRMASDVVSARVHERSEASERHAGDALFRLRRARKNCRLGWTWLAQRDYDALLRRHYPLRRGSMDVL